MRQKHIKSIGVCLVILLTGACSFGLVGCSTNGGETIFKGPTLESLTIKAQQVNLATGSYKEMPSPIVLTKGDKTVSLRAYGKFSDGSTMELQGVASWVISDSNIVTVAMASSPAVVHALVTAKDFGSATVVGTVGGIKSDPITVIVQ